ncbi:MAG: HNH endonuclease, partial [Synechococcaceae cyanobacterium RM1_1_27]|nr:HNH endonuclease [Synechococcaceae cyanobacterium RM1_1_27]
MVAIPTSLRRLVIQRADNRCEYCAIIQAIGVEKQFFG